MTPQRHNTARVEEPKARADEDAEFRARAHELYRREYEAAHVKTLAQLQALIQRSEQDAEAINLKRAVGSEATSPRCQSGGCSDPVNDC